MCTIKYLLTETSGKQYKTCCFPRSQLIRVQYFAHLHIYAVADIVSHIVIVSNDINLTRLRDDDVGAAKTGVTETTTEAAVYSHPTNGKIKFWDLPGIGMHQFSSSSQK